MNIKDPKARAQPRLSPLVLEARRRRRGHRARRRRSVWLGLGDQGSGLSTRCARGDTASRRGRDRRPRNTRRALRHDRADRLLADRDRAREGPLQEVRHQLDGRRRAPAGPPSATRSSNGDIQATHMLIGMPLASTMGLLGSPKKPMVIPWLLNRNGQAITLEGRAQGQGRATTRRRSSRSSRTRRRRASR